MGGRIATYLGERFPKGDIRILSRKNGQASPPWSKGYDLLCGDILDEASLLTACKGVDMVIHLAAVNEIDSAKDPFNALKVNGEGTLRLLNAAAENNVQRFIYFSTFHVYGFNAKGRITEETVPAPFHPYAITHHVAEDFVRMFAKNKNMQCIVLRLSNGFGYPSHPEVNRWTLAYNDFCLQAALTNKIVLKTGGKQHRDFITLTDVSRCVEHILKNEKAFHSEDIVYNLGGRHSVSIMDAAKNVASRAEKILSRRPEIIFEAGAPHGGTGESVDYAIDKIAATGFNLLSNVDEEIDKMLLFCAENREVLRCRLK